MSRKITITILGRERILTLDELVEIYKSIDDPNPERNALLSFNSHKKIQKNKEYLYEISDDDLSTVELAYKYDYPPEKIEKIVDIAFSNDYDYNYGVFGGSVPEEIFELIDDKLPLEDLEKFSSKIHDEEYSSRLEKIIEKKKKEKESKKEENNNQSKPSEPTEPSEPIE